MTMNPQLIETIVEDLAAEHCYADMLAHPETVVDAFDLFDVAPPVAKEPAFDDCNPEQHYAMCGYYRPFERCPFGSHWHYVDDGFTAYRYVGKCPNATEYGTLAEQACELPKTEG